MTWIDGASAAVCFIAVTMALAWLLFMFGDMIPAIPTAGVVLLAAIAWQAYRRISHTYGKDS